MCIGTTNEMEAGYAADAQARLNGIGVACVTYGVGSFSALNAIAGAYVERCPVVLINGTANADKAQPTGAAGRALRSCDRPASDRRGRLSPRYRRRRRDYRPR